ncbi:hypothetical protein LZ31DRAFT_479195, partial [Colletotrichum somersetense]
MEALHRRKPLALSSPGARFNCDSCDRRFKSQKAVGQHMDDLDHRKKLALTLPDAQFGCDFREAADQHMDDLGHRKKLPIGQVTNDLTGYERLISQICPKYLTKDEANEIRVQFDKLWQENNQVL